MSFCISLSLSVVFFNKLRIVHHLDSKLEMAQHTVRHNKLRIVNTENVS